MWNRSRTRDMLASAAASLGLLVVLVGVPAALIVALGWPLPRTPPSPDAVVIALRYGQIAPETLLRVLAVVLWVVWSLVAMSVGLEVAAVVRGTVARRVPGAAALQHLAARMVATVLLLSSTTTRAAAAPLPAALPQPPAVTVAVDAIATGSSDGLTRERDTDGSEPTFWSVERGDSLWTIAECTLGDGRRWRAIAALNVGRTQPDGAQLRRGDTLIRPGWRLELPPDATLPERATQITVQPGDDLWHLAEEHLDDGERWRELFAENRGRRQPSGGRLTDPDVIRPGWVLDLPDDEHPGKDDDGDHRGRAIRQRDAGAAGSTAAMPPPVTPRTLHPQFGPRTHSSSAGAPDHAGSPASERGLAPTQSDRAPASSAPDRDQATPTPGRGTASPTPDRDPATPTSGRGTASPTPDRGTASPTPDRGPATPTPGRGTASPTPDRGHAPPPSDRARATSARPQVAPPGTPTARTGDERTARRTGPPQAAGPDEPPRLTSAAPSVHTTGESSPPGGAPAWPVAGALLAAGLIGLLARRRRHWLRVHGGAGDDVGAVDPEAAELERWLRAMADHDLDRRLDQVLCVLTDHFDEHDVSPVVAGVEIGEQVTLRLADPCATAPPGIVVSEDGNRWTLSAELEMAAPGSDERYVPALLSCGVLRSGALLLINPLAVGTLGVVGTTEDIAEAATSWTAELASGGAATGVEIVVVGGHHPLVERLARVTVAPDVDGAIDRVRRVLDDAHDADARPTYVVVIHAPPVAHDDAAALRRAVDHPRAGLVLIGGHAETHIHLAGARVRLAPDDEWLDAPAWLTPDDWDRFGELLRRASGGPAPAAPAPVLHGVAATVPVVATDDPAGGDEATEPAVGLLGPLTLRGHVAQEDLALDRDAAELLTYLAVERTGADPVTLRRMLSPTRSDDDVVARASAAIASVTGEDPDGPPLVETDDGRLEATDAISTDLARFQQLVRGLDRLPLAEQARRMHAALDLVRGEPFTDGARWAHASGRALQVASLIVDVAHRLAMQALAVSDLERAMFAVERGLRAAPTSELLHRDGMRIADAAGDRAALDAGMQALRDRVAADGGWVTHETEALYLRLRGASAAMDGQRRDAS